jgi:hypothetical protein
LTFEAGISAFVAVVGSKSRNLTALLSHLLIVYFLHFSVASTDNAEPRPKKPKLEKSEGARGRSSGFLAPIPISEGLAKFLGAEDGKVSRADAVKRIWDYIKENNLQVCCLPITYYPSSGLLVESCLSFLILNWVISISKWVGMTIPQHL